ncbi:autophagy-related protein 13a-like [Oryza brachyantha]|uniref:autophagy-related protein 13a-like n=1 Tax=Oryza brachyantha TaxID=4533 RepID=UPI001ADC5613|nr:autophagy-related protein 13a-like [Oryza brachyantha]
MSSMSDSGTGGRGGVELMVKQFHLKVLDAVLAVRGPRPLQPAASASFTRRDRWFHLPLHDPPPPLPAAEGVEAPAPGEPLVVDIHLAPAGGGGAAGGDVVERWTVACEPWPDAAAAAAGEGIPVNRAYKRCITMLRSVYATLRFLPAYRVFRLLCANQSYNYEMVHRVRSFAAPLSRDEEAAMRSYSFVPVETQHGRLVVSVQYLPSLAAFNLEISSLSPSMLIPDYVGSPAAEPMRAFPASLTEAAGSSFPLFNQPQRPHSWAPAALWAQAPAQQASFSPPQLLDASPTPSPPNFPSGYLQHRPKVGSAPVSIPQIGDRRNPFHRPITFPPPSPRRLGESGTGSAQQSPSENSRSLGRGDGLRMMDPYASLSPGHKGKDSKDESGRFSALSCDSPRRDDLDDADYPFAVDDVDTPTSQPGSSDGKEARDQASSSSHRSQDAAVGSLVHLLKTARPLRNPNSPSQVRLSNEAASTVESNEAASTSSIVSRRKSDALEKLQSFKEIKERLMSRSRAKQQESPEKPKQQEPPEKP